MTRDDIPNMPAGREMDALIARHVFDYEIIYALYSNDDIHIKCGKLNDGSQAYRHVPLYSTHIAAAWEVVEKLINSNWRFYFRDMNDDIAGKSRASRAAHFQIGDASGYDTGHVEAPTAPLAICRAALMTEMK